jgi:hypothetical protein
MSDKLIMARFYLAVYMNDPSDFSIEKEDAVTAVFTRFEDAAKRALLPLGFTIEVESD